MQTSAISGSTSAGSASTTSGLNRMTTEDFYNLLVTELQQQDPLEPTKTADMIGQVSQIRSIEQSAQLTQTLQQLTQQQRTAGASDLLGKYVEGVGINASGEAALISGVATAIRFGSDGTAIIELDSGAMLSANNVTRVTAKSPEPAPTTDAATSKKNQQTAKTPAWRTWLDHLLYDPVTPADSSVHN